MALISLCCYDTEDNQRSRYTYDTILSLLDTVDLDLHRIIVVDNNSCEETKEILSRFRKELTIITLSENVGTAQGINRAWKLKEPKEHLIKMDNDVVINYSNWVDEMIEYIEADKNIGILGLKRKDLMESPTSYGQFKSTLRMLPHQNGESWKIVEDVDHVMGTCQMYNWRLIEKIGGLVQPSIYGFDDTLASVRCHIAGFKTAFIPHIDIDHIDTKENPYWQQKRDMAAQETNKYYQMKEDLISGKLSIFQKL